MLRYGLRVLLDFDRKYQSVKADHALQVGSI
jgi:hypothetical protein